MVVLQVRLVRALRTDDMTARLEQRAGKTGGRVRLDVPSEKKRWRPRRRCVPGKDPFHNACATLRLSTIRVFAHVPQATSSQRHSKVSVLARTRAPAAIETRFSSRRQAFDNVPARVKSAFAASSWRRGHVPAICPSSHRKFHATDSCRLSSAIDSWSATSAVASSTCTNSSFIRQPSICAKLGVRNQVIAASQIVARNLAHPSTSRNAYRFQSFLPDRCDSASFASSIVARRLANRSPIACANFCRESQHRQSESRQGSTMTPARKCKARRRRVRSDRQRRQATAVPFPPPPHAFLRSASLTSPTPAGRRRPPRSAGSSQEREGTARAHRSPESAFQNERAAASDLFPLPAFQLAREKLARRSLLEPRISTGGRTSASPQLAGLA